MDVFWKGMTKDHVLIIEERLCRWFQGLGALPGIKGEKGIVGFPGPRVSENPPKHY